MNIVKNGKNRLGIQTCLCKGCGSFRMLSGQRLSYCLDPGIVERLFPINKDGMRLWKRQE